MKKLLILLGFLNCFQCEIVAQDTRFDLTIMDSKINARAVGASVNVYSIDNFLLESYSTDTAGQVDVYLPKGKKYKVKVSQDGMVPRYFFVDLNSSDLLDGYFDPTGLCSLVLFEEKKGVDYSYVLEHPITTFYYEFNRFAPYEMKFNRHNARKMARKTSKYFAHTK